MNEHQKRLATAAVGIVFAFAVYFFLHDIGLRLLTVLASLVAYWEFLSLLLHRQAAAFHWKRISAIGAAVFFLLTPIVFPIFGIISIYFCLLLFLLSALVASHIDKNSDSLPFHLQDAMAQSLGLVYIVFFLSFFPRVYELKNGEALIVLLLLIIWGGDAAAYYGGKSFGKHKLSPKLSPGKSVEGGVSAVLFSMLAAVGVHYWRLHNAPILFLAILSAFCSVVAQAGDLLESLVKRVAHVKDSGKFFPGHGGVYDRFDSLILAAPFFYFFAQFLV